MKAILQPRLHQADWSRLLAAERELEAQIAAAEEQAHARIVQAREAQHAALPDADALAASAAVQERFDIEQQCSELARIAAEAQASVLALKQAPDTLVETLAQRVLAALPDDAPTVQRP